MTSNHQVMIVGPTMSSREIAELTGKNHADVMRDIRNLCAVLAIEASNFADYYIGSNGKRNPVFLLPKRETLILVSGYNIQMRARIIDRWQELEQAASGPQFRVPQTLPEALRLAADLADHNKVLEAKVEEQAPKVKALDRIAGAAGEYTLRDAAKVCQVKPAVFNALLVERQWMYKDARGHHGYAHAINHGYIRQSTYEHRPGRVSYQVLITPKGIAHLSEKIGDWLRQQHADSTQKTQYLQ